MGTAHLHDLSSVADQICLKPLQHKNIYLNWCITPFRIKGPLEWHWVKVCMQTWGVCAKPSGMHYHSTEMIGRNSLKTHTIDQMSFTLIFLKSGRT